jgi:hypothetical protein
MELAWLLKFDAVYYVVYCQIYKHCVRDNSCDASMLACKRALLEATRALQGLDRQTPESLGILCSAHKGMSHLLLRCVRTR